MKHLARSERDLLRGHSTFRESFRILYLVRYEQAVSRLTRSSVTSRLQLSEAFKRVVKSVLSDLEKDLWDIIYSQLISLEKPSLQRISTLVLDDEQYKVYNMLCNSWVLKVKVSIHTSS
jgi:hypothetical protein